MNVLKLNLPPPSDVLRALVMSNLDQLTVNPGGKIWLDNFHGGINSVAHSFVLVQALEMQLNLEYKTFFPNRNISAVMGVMKNTGSVPACLPPHWDRGRAIGINYYLELGGSAVETVFYDQEKSAGVAGNESRNFLYQDLSEISRHQFHEGWYACNVCRAHSVEKIENSRYFLAIALADSQYRIEDFAREYTSLVEQEYT
jgi:hypothetical protein